MEKLDTTRLRVERVKRGWSQHHVAYGSGVHQVFISYGERGYPALKKADKRKLADFFGMNMEALFPEEEIFPKDLKKGREIIGGYEDYGGSPPLAAGREEED